jgi:hypothetical protein
MTRRICLIVAALLFASPALADVNITIVDETGGVGSINYTCTGGEDIRAFALDCNVDNGASIVGISDFFTGESGDPGSQGYGIFPGSFRDVINAADPNWADPNYNPVAPSGDPDAAGALGGSAVTIELGSLYVDDNQPPATGTLCKLQLSGPEADCNLCVSLNSSRGGVVHEVPETAVTTNMDGGPVCQKIILDCFPSGHPDYTEWGIVGKPDSWCIPRQCHGDADGLQEKIGKQWYWVGYDDLDVFLTGFFTGYSGDPATDPWIAADFDRAPEKIGKQWYRVGYDDLDVFLDYFFTATVDPNCQ